MIIYKTTNKVNGKIYVGQDSKNNKNYFGSGKLIQCAFKKYGKENFTKEILCECKTKKELDKKEQFWIKKLNSQNNKIGYNLADGGGGALGVCPSIETRQKMSEIARRNMTPEKRKKIGLAGKGRKVSNETRKKLSRSAKIWHKTVGFSNEAIEKMRNANIGRTFNKEQLKKLSDSHLGIKQKEATKQKISNSLKGRVPWNKGIKGCFSKETIIKLKQRINKNRGGYKLSDETKLKMSNSKIGIIRGKYKKK